MNLINQQQNKRIQKPLVSVIIPVYNAAQYLPQCLDCVIHQSLRDIEIICIDDGSTDNSLEILKTYAKHDHRITVLRQKNLYAGVARNAGLEISGGKYICFLDADDVFHPNMLKKMSDLAEKQNADLVICGASELWPDGKTNEMPWTINRDILPPVSTFAASDVADDLYQLCFGWPWDKMFRRDIIDKYGLRFSALHHSNDTFFVMAYLSVARRITILPDNCVYYRQNISGISNNKDNYPECYAVAIRELKNFLKRHSLWLQYSSSFYKYLDTFAQWHYDTIKSKKAQQCVLAAKENLINEIIQEKSILERIYENTTSPYITGFKTIRVYKLFGIIPILQIMDK